MPTTSNFGWTTPADTDLVKDGAAAIRTLGNGIDTSLVDLKGGTTGQVLSKASNTDLDFTWSSVDPLTILDAKGDLISATAADTPARLASSGVNGDVLTVDTSTSTGLKWAAPSAGPGALAQVATGTLSGSSPLTISSLGTYSVLYLGLYNVDLSSNTTIGIQLNTDTGNNYRNYGGRFTTGGQAKVNEALTNQFHLSGEGNVNASTIDNSFYCLITDTKTTGFTQLEGFGQYKDINSSDAICNVGGIYAVSAAITSLSIVTGTGTFQGGTYRLFGA